MWKVNIIKEITNITQNSLEFITEEDNFLSKEQLQEIMDFVSASFQFFSKFLQSDLEYIYVNLYKFEMQYIN